MTQDIGGKLVVILNVYFRALRTIFRVLALMQEEEQVKQLYNVRV